MSSNKNLKEFFAKVNCNNDESVEDCLHRQLQDEQSKRGKLKTKENYNIMKRQMPSSEAAEEDKNVKGEKKSKTSNPDDTHFVQENPSALSPSTKLRLQNIMLQTQLQNFQSVYKKRETESGSLNSDKIMIDKTGKISILKAQKEHPEHEHNQDGEDTGVGDQKKEAAKDSEVPGAKDSEVLTKKLQNQLSESYEEIKLAKRENSKLFQKIAFLEDKLVELKEIWENEKAENADLKRQVSQLKNRIIGFRRNLVDKENVVSSLQNGREQAEILHQQAIENYEYRIDELQKLADSREEEFQSLQKQLDETTEKLGMKTTEMDQAIFDHEDEITKLQRLVQSKVHHIRDLEQQDQKQEKLFAEKNKELEKTEVNLKLFVSAYAKSEEEISKLKNQNDSLQHQFDQLIQEKTDLAKLNEQQIKTLQAEMEEMKKKLEDRGKVAEKQLSSMDKTITDRAREMFNDWKRGDKEKRREEKRNCKCPEKDQRILELEKELVEEKETNKTLSDSANIPVYNGPKWLVPEEICQRTFSENPDIKVFLPQFVTHLFNCAELLLPEEKLSPEKMEEAKNVILHFFKPEENNGLKKLYFGELKSVLNLKRYPARARAYRSCDTNRSVAFTSDGTKFYYALKAHNVWKPCSDKKCQNIMAFRKTAFSPFGIPSEYASAEYILILQNSSVDEAKIHKMSTKNGMMELVTRTKCDK